MQLKVVISLSVLFFAVQVESLNFGVLIDTIRDTVEGANSLVGIVNAIHETHAQGGIICPREEFQAKSVAVTALCQLPGEESDESCRRFGEQCISMKGKWGCGTLDRNNKRGCMFSVMGAYDPNVVFDDEVGHHRGRVNIGNQYLFGRRVAGTAQAEYEYAVDGRDYEEPEDEEKHVLDRNSFFADGIISGLDQYDNIYNELQKIEDGVEEEAIGVAAMVLKIVGMLAVKGFTPPLHPRMCSPCKAACSTLFFMKSSWKNVCKYDACIKFLGGYKGPEAEPSCDVLK